MDFYWKLGSYNNFFYSTLCHVCKQAGGNIVLTQCVGCNMITYCSEEHQKLHWPYHKELCTIIQYVRKTPSFSAASSAYQDSSRMMKLLKDRVRLGMTRELLLYEVHMFQYPMICLMCRTKSDELEQCSHCMAVWLCAQHKNMHDDDNCYRLKQCLKSDVTHMQKCQSVDFLSPYCSVSSYEEKFSDIKMFINIYGNVKGFQIDVSPDLVEIEQSIYVTRPLTLLYGMRLLNCISDYENCKKTSLIIHIIATHLDELETLPGWEILLHILSNLKFLKVVVIGPLGSVTTCQNVRIKCDFCKQNNKLILTMCQNMSYDEYIKISKEKPDFIMRFNNYNSLSNVYKNMWTSSLEVIATLKCPLLVCYSKRKYSMENTVINNTFGARATIEYQCYTNPFASLKPYKGCDDDDSDYSLYYDNSYINVYKSLCS